MKTEERSRHTVWMEDTVWQRVQEHYKSYDELPLFLNAATVAKALGGESGTNRRHGRDGL